MHFEYTLISACLLQLHYLRLPKDIKGHHVILMDPTVATGAAAIMAIRVLLDHDVPEENIYLVSLIMARQGRVTLTVFYIFIMQSLQLLSLLIFHELIILFRSCVLSRSCILPRSCVLNNIRVITSGNV